MTETSGVGMYSAKLFISRSRSSIGVRPAAFTSFKSGSEIMPSGRTGTVRLIASFFHTPIWSTSSGPIRYPSRLETVLPFAVLPFDVLPFGAWRP